VKQWLVPELFSLNSGNSNFNGFGFWRRVLPNNNSENPIFTFSCDWRHISILRQTELPQQILRPSPLQPKILAPFIISVMAFPLPIASYYKRVLIFNCHLQAKCTIISIQHHTLTQSPTYVYLHTHTRKEESLDETSCG